MAQKGRGIFMVYVDIDAQHVQEFNKWYNKEHLPELLSVPGILSAARYEAVKGGPQYLACYELESVAVMQTPAFTNRPRTPWGQKVSPSVIGKNLTRIVGEQIYPDGIEMPERGMAPVLQIGRMSVPAEVDAEWNAWYSREYVPGYRKVPGVIYARRYRVLEGTSGYSTVYEFASTAVPESPEWKEQQQHSSPNSPRMRQAMTHAPGSAGVYVRVNPSSPGYALRYLAVGGCRRTAEPMTAFGSEGSIGLALASVTGLLIQPGREKQCSAVPVTFQTSCACNVPA